MKAYTLGYEGLALPAYISALKSSGIGVVLDVREKAWSRKPGFSKTALQQALCEVGIEYIHVPSAGNPSINRKTAKSTAECLRRYGKFLKANPACLDELMTHIKHAAKMGRPACMTCYEHLPVDCHRSVLIDALLPLAPKLKFTHLPLSKTI